MKLETRDKETTMTDWKADLSTINGHCGFEVADGKGVVATVYANVIGGDLKRSEERHRPENASSVERALLIAAAPKMREALEKISRCVDAEKARDIASLTLRQF